MGPLLSADSPADFFELRTSPFPVTADASCIWPHPAFDHALDVVARGLADARGLIVITGEIGTGKTTLLNAVAREFPKALVIRHGWLKAEELPGLVRRQVGLAADAETQQLEAVLRARNARKGSSQAEPALALFIDEAQHLGAAVLEELRLLLNLEDEGRKLVTVVLFGQPELARLLAAPEQGALRSRVAGAAHLGTLSEEESRSYVAFRIREARRPGALLDTLPRFSDEAVTAIHAYARGRARVIHAIADEALRLAALDGVFVVAPALVEEAVAQFSALDHPGVAAAQRVRARPRRAVSPSSPQAAEIANARTPGAETPATTPPGTTREHALPEAQAAPAAATPTWREESPASPSAAPPARADSPASEVLPSAVVIDEPRPAPAVMRTPRSRARRLVALTGIVALVAAGVTISSFLWVRQRGAAVPSASGQRAGDTGSPSTTLPEPPSSADVPAPNVAAVAESGAARRDRSLPLARLLTALGYPVPDNLEAMTVTEAASAAKLVVVHAELPPSTATRLAMPALLMPGHPLLMNATPAVVTSMEPGGWTVTTRESDDVPLALPAPSPVENSSAMGNPSRSGDTFVTLTYLLPVRAWMARPLGPRKRGDDVKALQELLAKAGYLAATPNGWYGAGTIAALQKLRDDFAFPPGVDLDPLALLALESLARRHP